jgi:hypothetical protein
VFLFVSCVQFLCLFQLASSHYLWFCLHLGLLFEPFCIPQIDSFYNFLSVSVIFLEIHFLNFVQVFNLQRFEWNIFRNFGRLQHFPWVICLDLHFSSLSQAKITFL